MHLPSDTARFQRSRWLFIALCGVFYVLPIEICPAPPGPVAQYPFCLTASSREAGALYIAYTALPAALIILGAFSNGVALRDRFHVTARVLPFVIAGAAALHAPTLVLEGGAPRYYEANRLFLLFLMAVIVGVYLTLPRITAAPWLWGGEAVRERLPYVDRRRAAFWHPLIALVLFFLAAATNQFIVVYP